MYLFLLGMNLVGVLVLFADLRLHPIGTLRLDTSCLFLYVLLPIPVVCFVVRHGAVARFSSGAWAPIALPRLVQIFGAAKNFSYFSDPYLRP